MTIKQKIDSNEITKPMKQTESDAIWILKALAILTVMAAHVTMSAENSIFAQIVVMVWRFTANVGVIAFFVVSGYFYKRASGDTKKFYIKKFKTLILPWLCCGTITYAAVFAETLLSHKTECPNWIEWIMGHGTWYYYIAIQMFLLVVFKWIWDKESLLWICVAGTIVFRTVEVMGIVPYMQTKWITPYQDAFNWIGFFAIGILIRRHQILNYLLNKKVQVSAVFITVLSCFIIVMANIKISFNIVETVKGISIAILLWGVANKLTTCKGKQFLIKIGKYSYCIYLMHMPIVQPICFRLGSSLLMHLMRPIIALLVMVVIIEIATKITAKMKYGKKIEQLVGLR